MLSERRKNQKDIGALHICIDVDKNTVADTFSPGDLELLLNSSGATFNKVTD
jgi:hypothetical protein